MGLAELHVGVDAWMIQDGHVADFVAGATVEWGLEFFPYSLEPAGAAQVTAVHLGAARYRVHGRVLAATPDGWALDAGFRALRDAPPPATTVAGAYLAGELYLGLDPFFAERPSTHADLPRAIYRLRVREIRLETTPWLELRGRKGRPSFIRADAPRTWTSIPATDAARDDDGRAHYVVVGEWPPTRSDDVAGDRP